MYAPHVYWANLLLSHIDTTEYKHSSGPVSWYKFNDKNTYTSITDCSGFINSLLKQSYGLNNEQFRTIMGVNRPYAKTYYDAIINDNSFINVASVKNYNIGDFITLRYLDSAKGKNTGHIMLINELPIMAKPNEYHIKIIDQSGAHGSNDTRYPDKTGLGSGIFRIYTDNNGIPTGYSWSTSSKSKYISVSLRPIATGRFNPYNTISV